MEDNFFEQHENTQAPQDGVITDEPVHQDNNNQPQEGNSNNDQHFDDFFGGNEGTQQQPNEFDQAQQQQHDYSAFDAAGQSGYDQSTQLASNVVGGSNRLDQDFFDASEATPQQLSEHEERRLRLQKEDQERTNKLIAKQVQNKADQLTDNNEENAQKNAKISAAKQFLQSWKTDKDKNIQTRKQVCLQEEEVLVQSRKTVTYKNPWEKVTDNISLKSSDNLGQKDVSRMRESILNKKADLANNVTKN